ncbi:MAG TPA: hypothetical protein VF462_05445 [Micromonosporaceae bacterium]
MTEALTCVDLSVAGNEASDLLPVHAPEVLAAYDAHRAFWTVLDEGPVERCLALLVEHADGSWAAHHLSVDAGVENGRTEDGEALAYVDGWVYVLGSHFGSKAGPLRPKRAFVARFREVEAVRGPVQLQVVRNKFRLHRAINDALAAADITPLPPGDRVRHRFIVETLARGTSRAKSWVSRLAQDDLPINVEAAAVNPSGTLLLGLRFPVTDKGEPILVEVDGLAGMFDDDPRTWPTVLRAYALTGVTPPNTLTGVRGMYADGTGGYHAVIGSIDALDKGSVLVDEHPTGGDVTCRHVRFALPAAAVGRPASGGIGAHSVPGELVADLAPLHNVEGLAAVDGTTYYVTDEDHRVAIWSS